MLPQVSQQNENSLMDATFEFFNSPSNSSASSVCDDDEDNKNVSNDNDARATSPVPLSDSPCKNIKVRALRRHAWFEEFAPDVDAI